MPAGFYNDGSLTNSLVAADNVDFSGSANPAPQVMLDGQLLIGSSVAPNIQVGTLTAGTGITVTNGHGTITIASTAATTDLHTARFIVASSTSGTGANFTTIASAIAAAVGTGINSTIFLQPGTYTEDFSLPANINICAYSADAFTPNVTILGNITCTGAGSRSISGIRLQTNSAAFLTLSANAAISVSLNDCYLNCTNHTGITFSSSNASANINIIKCAGDIGTTGISLYTMTTTGALGASYTSITNSGVSTTASTNSAGTNIFLFCNFNFPITTSSTAGISIINTIMNLATNTTALTANGSGISGANFCEFVSGSASAVSIGSGATLVFINNAVNSSNTNAISGLGTINYSQITFNGSSSTVNTSTQNPYQIGPKIYTNGGISFDGGTNTLVNYATGTWTPGVSFGGGTTGITYTTQQGYYTRIGNCVFINFKMVLSSKGSSTGSALLTGLPITAGGNSPFSIAISLCAGLTIASTTTVVSANNAGATTTANLFQTNYNGASVAPVNDTQFANTTQLFGSGVYIIA